jgi:hypothetical protein
MKKRITLSVLLFVVMLALASCIRPYDKPEFVTIEPSQTAFLIPLVGDTETQASFESEELLASAKVAMKEVQIPHRWVQAGRMDWQGEWKPTMRLIVVERKPETREWNNTAGTGTSAVNQAIYAESSESIGFSVGMNCSAQIDTEDDAVKFLYSYNNKPLAEVMDTEIRARVESVFVEECAKRTLNDILREKDTIMEAVREDVFSYFENKGITITVLGMKDGLEYDDPAIQQSINEKFSSEQRLTTQENENKRIVSEAEAIAEANKIISDSITESILRKEYIDKWDGVMPKYTGDSGNIILPME